MSPKRLVLLRHAKSSWADRGIPDHDRPLNDRGHRAAIMIGRHLHDAGFQFDLVLCSSAARARQTLELLSLAGGTEVLVEDQLYGARASDLLGRLRGVSAAVTSVLLVGHNPGIEDLARMLVADSGDLSEKFPTAALADLRLPLATWHDLDSGIARLNAFVIPRDLGKESEQMKATVRSCCGQAGAPHP